MVEVLVDRGFQLLGRAEAASTNLLLGERGEEAFHLVQPACRGGCEVDMEARVAHHPALDGGGLVGGVEN